MANFYSAFEYLMKFEGREYVNDPDDPGGETKFGISKKSFPTVDIKNLDEEEAKEIYFDNFWNENHYMLIVNQDIAQKIFSLAVNIGAGRANKILQKSLNILYDAGLEEDGIIGRKTIMICNRMARGREEERILRAISAFAVDHYEKIGNSKYFKGWFRRAVG